jgi:hypothetical protein
MSFFRSIEMEEHWRELEHDLREKIDLLENQLREVGIPKQQKTISQFSFLERTTKRTTSIYHRRSRTNNIKIS